MASNDSMSRRIGLWLMPLAGMGWGVAVSQEREVEPQQLPAVEVTSRALPTRLDQGAASVTVIPEAQLRRRHGDSVTEVLRDIPGVHVDMAGGRGSVSSIYLRGGDPNFTMVLINGVRINDPTNSRGGSYDLSTLGVDDIQRIEIVRGPMSATFGSDALSGVINIVTRGAGDGPQHSITGAAGHDGYRHATATSSGRHGATDHAVTASFIDNGEPVPGSEFISRGITASGGRILADDMELRGFVRYTDSHLQSFPDDSGGPLYAVRRDVDRRDADELTTGITLDHIPHQSWTHTLRIALYDRNESVSSPGVAPGVRDPAGIPPNTMDNEFRRYEAAWRHRVTLPGEIETAAGIEWQLEDGSSDATLSLPGGPLATHYDMQRHTGALFVAARYPTAPGPVLQGALRLDMPEDADARLSPRLGITYPLTTGSRLKASWAQGFKLPSFFALGNPIVGNADLAPETSDSFEAGIATTLRSAGSRLELTWFLSRFKNAIDLAEGPPPLLVNRDEITARGVELAFDQQLARHIDMGIHITYTDTDIKDSDESLRNRPQWRGGLQWQWQLQPDLHWSTDMLYVGQVDDSSIPTGDRELDAYTRVDTRLSWQASKITQVFIKVHNLFDADYQEFVGFPAPGLLTRVGVKLLL